MVVDPQAWLVQCTAHLMLLYLGNPRCGEDDVLDEAAAKRLAGDLMEDPDYRHLEPAQAAERYMQDFA